MTAAAARELVLLALTNARHDARGNLTLIGGAHGPDVAVEAADLDQLAAAVRAARRVRDAGGGRRRDPNRRR